MAEIVLVHGAFQGGWVWQAVADQLRTHGHKVFTPTLSGAGDRVHLLNSEIDLTTYIEDIFNLIFYESLLEVMLVGHSYAGMVITAVAHKLPRKITRLVYLDAVVPQAEKSFLDIAGIEFVRFYESYVTGWQVRPWPLSAFGIELESGHSWFGTKLVPFPLKAFKTTFPSFETKPLATRTYIHCTGRAKGFLDDKAKQCRADGWDYCELDTGHAPMVTAPEKVATALNRIAGTQSTLQRLS